MHSHTYFLQDEDPDAEDVKRTSRREVALLRHLQHPNVVRFVDEFLVHERLFIVMVRAEALCGTQHIIHLDNMVIVVQQCGASAWPSG